MITIRQTDDFGFVQFIPLIVAGIGAGASGLEYLSSKEQSQAAIYQAQTAAQIAEQKAETEKEKQKMIMYGLLGGAALLLFLRRK